MCIGIRTVWKLVSPQSKESLASDALNLYRTCTGVLTVCIILYGVCVGLQSQILEMAPLLLCHSSCWQSEVQHFHQSHRQAG